MFNILKKSAASAALLTGVDAHITNANGNGKHTVNVSSDQLELLGFDAKDFKNGRVSGVALWEQTTVWNVAKDQQFEVKRDTKYGAKTWILYYSKFGV